MTRYRIEETVVDTEKASFCYKLQPRKCGYGYDTGDLYRSKKGRWYLVHDFDWAEDRRTLDYAEWLSPEEAARIILTSPGITPEGLPCEGKLPDFPELKKIEDNISE